MKLGSFQFQLGEVDDGKERPSHMKKEKRWMDCKLMTLPKLTRKLTSYTKYICVYIFIIEKDKYIKMNTTCFHNLFTTLKIKGIY